MSDGVPLPRDSHALLDSPQPCVLTTLRPDGWPQSIAIWCGREGDALFINAGEDTAWLRHIRREPRISLVVVNPEDMYDYVAVRGTVVAIDPDDGYEHIDALSLVYEGTERFAWARPEDGVRFKLRVRPDNVRVYKSVRPPGPAER